MNRRFFLSLALIAPFLRYRAEAADLPKGLSPATFQVLDRMVDTALAAYNAQDARKYCADLDRVYGSRTPAETDDYGKSSMLKGRQQFGAYKSRALDPGMCAINRIEEGGVSSLVYRVQMEKGSAFLYVTVTRPQAGFKFGGFEFHDKPVCSME